jgi:SAM-dependent methyltransferase
MELRSAIKAAPLIGPALSRLHYAFSTLRKLGGVYPRTCPICSYHGRFRAFGDPPRWDAQCSSCGSLERHRLFALLLRDRPELVQGRVIHFAPEPGIARLIKPLAGDYKSADLMMSGCDLVLNLEQIDLPDQSVDVFVASHVLEHVDDRKALAELHRCLRRRGVAIIMIPIIEGWRKSYENEAIVSLDQRTLHFGQCDHVRYYGADVRNRMASAGFVLEEFTGSPEQCIEYGLTRGENVFLARRTS